jgi:Domain of unknown function (DUF4394)
MSNNKRWHKLLAASVAALITALVAVAPTLAENLNPDRLRVIGLTDDGRLVRFRAGGADRTRNIGAVSGLQSPDTALVGIDFRVQDRQLYGVGNGGGVYTLNTTNAQASLVNQVTEPFADGAQFFGVDFNPAADRLRIVNDVGQNLSHDVNVPGTGTASQTTLTYAPPVVLTPVVTGVAYTNNDLSLLTGTTLFDIDGQNDQVAIQSPPAAGLLVVTGKLGSDADPSAIGFEIYSDLDDNGVTVQNFAFAALLVSGGYGFYEINLLTGQATLIDNFELDNVVDIAIQPNQ